MPTINVLTFNGFENGLACCGSLHGRLKPRRYLVSYLNSYPLTFSPASQKVCTDYLCQIYCPIGLFSVGISSNGRIFGRIMIKPTDCSLSVFNASSLLENRLRSLEKDTSLSRNTKKERIVFPFEKKSISLQLDYNFLRNAIKGHVLMNAFVKPTPRKVW